MEHEHALTITVEHAAKVLGISRSTAYELVHSGDITSLRLGRRIVVPTARLAEHLLVSSAEVWAALGSVDPPNTMSLDDLALDRPEDHEHYRRVHGVRPVSTST